MDNSSKGVGKVLTSDANGTATWQTPASGSNITLTTTGTSGPATLTGSTLNIPVYSAGAGTVTNFSAGDLAPLFTTSEANTTTTPALSFTLTNALANSFLGNNTGSAAAPSYIASKNLGTVNGVSGASSPITLGGGFANSLVGSADATIAINNTSPLWNAKQLQGTNVSTAAPSTNQVLQYNTTTGWTPTTLPVAANDWHILGNSDAEITTGAEVLDSAPTGNYLGIQGGTDALVLATAGLTHGILSATGSLTGGNKGTGGASVSWGSNNTINGTPSSIALGRDNTATATNDNFISTAIGRNNIPSGGATVIGFYNGYTQDPVTSNPIQQQLNGVTTFAFGRFNYQTGLNGGLSVGYFNNNNGGIAMGAGLKISSINAMAVGYGGSVGAVQAEVAASGALYFGSMGGSITLPMERFILMQDIYLVPVRMHLVPH